MGKRKRATRSKRTMTYHGRSGKPVIHTAPASSRKYIMVRKRGGGTKRLYLDKHGYIPEKHREPVTHRR